MRKLSRSGRLSLYNAVVRPQLEYASVVWGGINSKLVDKLEAVQLQALRWILPCAQNVSAWAIRSELGVKRLETRRRKVMLEFWFDVRAGLTPKLVESAAKWRIEVTSTGKKPKAVNHCLASEIFNGLRLHKGTWQKKIDAAVSGRGGLPWRS